MSIPRVIAALCLGLVLCLPAPASAEKDPSKATQELERIQKELRGVKKKTAETEKKERSVLGDIERMDRSLAAKRRELKLAEKRLGGVSSEMSRTESEMSDTRARLAVKRADLAGRLEAMYKTGRAGGNWALLLTGDPGSMLRRYKYLSVMSGRDKRLMDEYAALLGRLDAQHDRLGEQRVRYEKVRTARDAEARKVQTEEQDKKRLLASLRKEKRSYISLQRELEESEARMKELIRRLEEAARARPAPLPGSIPVLRAGLDWPVYGSVISRFGKQKHPEYETYIYKKGIEIAASLGAEVHAVEAAEVVFADWFKGLGQVAILRHGGEYYTVYAHLLELKVKAGDKVARGQAIASVGDTGTPGGSSSLYFELRKGPDALDPLKWLKRR